MPDLTAYKQKRNIILGGRGSNILGGSRITADGDCSHEIKRCLLLERKAMTNLDSIFKSMNSSVLSFLYGPTLTSIHEYWKNHSFD